ncbi:ATP-binding cassette domain-containing protein [Microbacterium tumbae]
MQNDPRPFSIRADNLTLSYGGEPVVRNVSFEVAPGTVLGIVGESGSGKSTLAAAIAGFLPHFGGEVVSGDLDVAGESRSAAYPGRRAVIPRSVSGVTMIFQDAMTSMDPVATLGSQLTAALRRYPRGRRDSSGPVSGRRRRGERYREAVRLLESVGFVAPEQQLRQRPGDLSGGMRQRALIALALASRPRVLIADEPTSALDVKLATLTMRLLVESAREQATTLVVIAHDLRLVASYADAIAVMRAGLLVEHGPAGRLLSDPREVYTRQLLACVPSLDSYRQDRLVTVTARGGEER